MTKMHSDDRRTTALMTLTDTPLTDDEKELRATIMRFTRRKGWAGIPTTRVLLKVCSSRLGVLMLGDARTADEDQQIAAEFERELRISTELTIAGVKAVVELRKSLFR